MRLDPAWCRNLQRSLPPKPYDLLEGRGQIERKNRQYKYAEYAESHSSLLSLSLLPLNHLPSLHIFSIFLSFPLCLSSPFSCLPATLPSCLIPGAHFMSRHSPHFITYFISSWVFILFYYFCNIFYMPSYYLPHPQKGPILRCLKDVLS